MKDLRLFCYGEQTYGSGSKGSEQSGFLFLLAMKCRRNLDFSDNSALLSSKFNDLREKTGRLMKEAARAGLKLNERKCKTLRT